MRSMTRLVSCSICFLSRMPIDSAWATTCRKISVRFSLSSVELPIIFPDPLPSAGYGQILGWKQLQLAGRNLSSEFVTYQAVDLFLEDGDIGILAVDAGKTDIGDSVQLLQPLHYHVADH